MNVFLLAPNTLEYLWSYLCRSWTLLFIRNPGLLAALKTCSGDNSLAQSNPAAQSRKITSAVLAEHPFHLRRHPHPYTSADLPGDLDVPVGSLRMEGMIPEGQLKEQLHALPGNVPGLGRVVLASHSLDS